LPHRALPAAAALLACLLLAAAPNTDAAQTAKLTARFTPEHLGDATTMGFGFQIAPVGVAPTPLTGMSIAYPQNLGFATSGLGIAACSDEVLEVLGPKGCPENSQMGSGSAIVEIRIGPELVRENVTLSVFAGPSPDGYLHLLVAASGETPVLALVVLSGVLEHGRLQVVIPPIPSLPEAPYVVVTQMQITLGGHLTYYERVKGRNVPYHPAGVGLPSRCPRGGFAFAATFAFQDGSSSNAHTAIACPRGQ